MKMRFIGEWIGFGDLTHGVSQTEQTRAKGEPKHVLFCISHGKAPTTACIEVDELVAPRSNHQANI